AISAVNLLEEAGHVRQRARCGRGAVGAADLCREIRARPDPYDAHPVGEHDVLRELAAIRRFQAFTRAALTGRLEPVFVEVANAGPEARVRQAGEPVRAIATFRAALAAETQPGSRGGCTARAAGPAAARAALIDAREPALAIRAARTRFALVAERRSRSHV